MSYLRKGRILLFSDYSSIILLQKQLTSQYELAQLYWNYSYQQILAICPFIELSSSSIQTIDPFTDALGCHYQFSTLHQPIKMDEIDKEIKPSPIVQQMILHSFLSQSKYPILYTNSSSSYHIDIVLKQSNSKHSLKHTLAVFNSHLLLYSTFPLLKVVFQFLFILSMLHSIVLIMVTIEDLSSSSIMEFNSSLSSMM